MKNDNQFLTGTALIIATVALFLTGIGILALSAKDAYGAEKLSKREMWSVYCGYDKNAVTSDMKRLSRREIWSVCTGNDKEDRPSWMGKDKKTKDKKRDLLYNTDIPDYILHNNRPYRDLTKE